MTTACGVATTSRTHSRERPKLVRAATRSGWLRQDMSHARSLRGGSTLCLSGTGWHEVRPMMRMTIHVLVWIASYDFLRPRDTIS